MIYYYNYFMPLTLLWTLLMIEIFTKKNGLSIGIAHQEYFYVIRSFKSRKKFLINGARKCGTFTMMNIPDPEYSSLLKSPIFCKFIGTEKSPIWNDLKTVTVSRMLKHDLCRIATVALFCPLPSSDNTHFVISDKSDDIERKIIYCVGRRFYFESWHLLITFLELARLQGVDMVVLYMLSVQSAIFELAQLYEANGFLRLRSSLKMPTHMFTEMGFNPNMETEWNNEAIEYNECLYEHREHTNFIAFTTLDDAIISLPNYEPLPSVFSQLSEKYKNSPEFLLQVHDSYLNNLNDIMKNLKSNTSENFIKIVNDFWKYGIYLNAPIIDPKPTANNVYTKSVVIPQRVEVAWLHHAIKIEPGGFAQIVPYNSSLVIHLRQQLEPGYNATYPRIPQLKTENAQLYAPFFDKSQKMIDNLKEIINGHPNLSKLVERLPRAETFLDEFRKFNNEFHLMLKKLKKYPKSKSRCTNYLQHEPLTSRMQFGCINADNKWKLKKLIPFKNGLTKKTTINIAILDKRSFSLNEKCTDF